jgi:NAD(P)H-dependent FMN reductase
MDPLFLPVVLGTAREGRSSEAVAKFLAGAVERAGYTTILVDVRDFPLTATIPGLTKPEAVSAWRDIATRANGFIFVVPEYNHGYPGEFKLLLDSLYPEYEGKPVISCGVSSGPWGGTRVVEALLPVLIELKLVPLRNALYFPSAGKLFGEDGVPTDPAFAARADQSIAALARYARVLVGLRS